MTTFEDFDFKAPLAQAIRDAGFREPSPVQKEAIPLVLEGRDLIAQAHTGTGKTAAFGLPILQQLRCDGSVEALVIVPTRELATQVSDEIFRFGKSLGIRTATVYGGSSYTRQLQHVANASVVVATPGRLLDLLKSGKVELSPRFVVLDEADEMLDMGFLDDIREIFTHLPAERQTLLFSATMSREIRALAECILREPATVSITGGNVTNDKIRQLFYVVEERERDDALVRLLDYKQPEKCIIFCRMKKEVDRLRDYLAAQGYEARGLHGDMDQRQRESTIRAFKSGGAEILIATDVAARGLDVNDVSHVFNYHLPFDPESYVHRIGRTGRAGREGTAVSIVSPHEFRSLQRIQKSVGSNIESRIVPRIGEVHARKHDALLERIRETQADDEVFGLLETLKEEFDLTTLAARLLSLLRDTEEVRGADRIGKSLEEIERLFSRMKEDRGGRGSYQKRGRRNNYQRNRHSRKRNDYDKRR
ncbi:DEAD/DEAH box helicase [Nitratifractor sp.]